MNRFALTVVGSLFLCSSAFAEGFIPLQLADVDAQARTSVINKFVSMVGASAEDVIYYRNVQSGIGIHGDSWGDFNFTAEIWISNQRKFKCENDFIRASINRTTGKFTIDADNLDRNSKCTEVAPTE